MSRGHPHAQRGLSLVELLIGLALGLFVVALMLTLVSAHLRESRSLLLEARLTHDLHGAVDLVARDLRRAGYWGAAQTGIAQAGTPPLTNPYADVVRNGSAVSFRFSRDETENFVVDDTDTFGFRLRDRALEMQLGGSAWQAVTDVQTLVITGFTLTPTVDEIPLGPLCPKPCVVTTCPKQQIRRYTIDLTGQSAADGRLVRSAHAVVRLRNDRIVGACPA